MSRFPTLQVHVFKYIESCQQAEGFCFTLTNCQFDFQFTNDGANGCFWIMGLFFPLSLFWLFKPLILSSQTWYNIILDIGFSLTPFKVLDWYFILVLYSRLYITHMHNTHLLHRLSIFTWITISVTLNNSVIYYYKRYKYAYNKRTIIRPRTKMCNK